MEQTHESHRYTIPLAIVLAGGLIALAIFFGGGSNPSRSLTDTQDANIEVPAVNNNDHILGNPEAKIKLVQYSDTECPFCKTFHNTLKQVLATYPNDVALIFRHFPIANLHPRALKEAEALECASELGGETAFWKYLDEIFTRTNSNNTLDPAELPKIALAVGIDTASFNSCLASGKYTKKIEDSIAEAVKAGARGTPYSILITKDGQKMAVGGAEPFNLLKERIDSLLK